MIPEKLLARYHMACMEDYEKIAGGRKQGEYDFYRTFLIQTDYVPNKMIEAQAVVTPRVQAYTQILQARAYARQRLSELGVGT